MTPLDLVLALWIVCVTAGVYVGLPHGIRLLCGRRGPRLLPLVAGLLVWTVAGMTLLGAIRLVNAVTVVGLHAAYAAVVFAAYCGRFDRGAQRLLRAVAILYERLTGAGHGRRARPRLLRRAARATGWRVPPDVTGPQLVAAAALAALVCGTRIVPALMEARLLDPAAYDQLYSVRRLLAAADWRLTVGGPAWTAAIATLSAVDAAYVVRFLPAVLACTVTFAVAATVIVQGRRFDAALVAFACWYLAGSGAAAESPWAAVLSRQHAATGEYVAALLLLALIRDSRPDRGGGAWTALGAVMFAPPLGIVAAAALAFPQRLRSGAAALLWIGIAAAGIDPDAPAALRGVAATLPVALALGAGLVCASLPRDVQLPQRSTAAACGTLVALAGFSIVPPARVVEHDGNARQALRVVRHSIPGEWTIVAQSAPLLRGLAGARVLPLPLFLACASGSAMPECVTAQRTTTYVFVQKQPYTAVDLAQEQAALVAAERLAHAVEGARIEYEDETLRIYRVPPQPWPL
jgi:hypothetical protein